MPEPVPPLLATALTEPPRPQRAFVWEPAGWRTEMHDLPEVQRMLDDLPARVDRGLIRQRVLDELDEGRILSAFVGAMVWGYGDRGYGPVRVRWVLTGVKQGAHTASVRGDVPGLLSDAVEVVRAKGAVEGFRFMANAGRLKYLASAFFTKWLYFASALDSPDDARAAPILDKQVHDWLDDHAGVTLDISRTHEYRRYLDVLTRWGDRFARTPVQVEQVIFSLASGRG
ncbi:hypothetical protein [Mycolicibacterium sp. CBMA 226]|uniref:8-oxoguanine DNA glycosylase OGG fold protein n=1 Tax=Mycolicibacterium sp. CBMA 226 TaxID=2606611 RepID=UPI0012DE2B34|nr:hypothetical protein [Mycolicibacterium sp. CBMA 226]MUL78818.1 hypothetical protein [Mycolicibacterium sp. CBMA 226]QGW61113.1 hypothetical protein ICEMyc226_00081 [Mycolicibacterium sp.]